PARALMPPRVPPPGSRHELDLFVLGRDHPWFDAGEVGSVLGEASRPRLRALPSALLAVRASPASPLRIPVPVRTSIAEPIRWARSLPQSKRVVRAPAGVRRGVSVDSYC